AREFLLDSVSSRRILRLVTTGTSLVVDVFFLGLVWPVTITTEESKIVIVTTARKNLVLRSTFIVFLHRRTKCGGLAWWVTALRWPTQATSTSVRKQPGDSGESL